MIKHIVIWKLKESGEGKSKSENANIIKTGLESLKNEIAQIKAIEVGINFNESAQASDVVLNSEFETKEDLNIYQNHPAHLKVSGYVSKVVDERRVIDYEI